MDDSDTTVEVICMDIMAYLDKQPEAADTANGIARWWLLDRYALPLVESALQLLCTKGLVHAHPTPGGTAIYRASPVQD